MSVTPRLALAAAFTAGTAAGAVMHKRYVSPAFAFAAIRQILLVRREAITAIAGQQPEARS